MFFSSLLIKEAAPILTQPPASILYNEPRSGDVVVVDMLKSLSIATTISSLRDSFVIYSAYPHTWSLRSLHVGLRTISPLRGSFAGPLWLYVMHLPEGEGVGGVDDGAAAEAFLEGVEAGVEHSAAILA